METIPAGYLVFIYAIMALPFMVVILGLVSLIVVAILYFTNRRKTAMKLLKIVGIVFLVIVAFTWLTKSSLGI